MPRHQCLQMRGALIWDKCCKTGFALRLVHTSTDSTMDSYVSTESISSLMQSTVESADRSGVCERAFS